MTQILELLFKKYKIKVIGVSHFGAHRGQELQEYIELNIKNIHLFEPQKKWYEELKKISNELENVFVYDFGLGANNMNTKLYSSSVYEGVSASVLKPLKHKDYFPEVVFDLPSQEIEIVKYDDLKIENVNFLNIDIQGYELEALKGSVNSLKTIDCLFVEVSRDEFYEQNVKIKELDKFLRENSFVRVETFWYKNTVPHGDALYIKSNFVGPLDKLFWEIKNFSDYFEIKFKLINLIKKLFRNLKKYIKEKYYQLIHQLNRFHDWLRLKSLKYFYVGSNPHDKEAIGALLQWQLWAYSLSKIYNKKYVFEGFKNVSHYKFENLSKEDYSMKLNKFFCLSDLSVKNPENYEKLEIYQNNDLNIDEKFLYKNRRLIQRTFDKKIISAFKGEFLLEVGRKIPTPTIFDPSKTNIGVHLRVTNPDDVDFSEKRQYFDKDNNSVNKINKIINYIEQKYQNETLCFYLLTQYENEKLRQIELLNSANKLNFLIGEDIFSTMSILIHSDILIGANSSLSYVCHLLSGSESYFEKSFPYKLYPNSYFHSDGELI